MHPYLLDFGEVDLPFWGPTELHLPSYGVLLALGVLVAWITWAVLVRREGLDFPRAADAGFWTLIAGLLGAKVALYIVEWRSYWEDPSLFLETLRSGGVVWGGVLAGLVTFVALSRRAGLPTARLMDTLAVPVPLAQAVGRVGCFLAGCCWGRACDRPFAVTFGEEAFENTGVPPGIPRHPVQLYEAGANLLVAGLVFLVLRRPGRRPGQAVLTYLALYSAVRLGVEFFQGDRSRGLFWEGVVSGGVSTGQLVSALVLLASAGVGLWRAFAARRQEPSPPPTDSGPTDESPTGPSPA